jgi:hypothetical protein
MRQLSRGVNTLLFLLLSVALKTNGLSVQHAAVQWVRFAEWARNELLSSFYTKKYDRKLSSLSD